MTSAPPHEFKRVLVVDDEPTLLDLFPLALASATREIETAEDGPAALKKLRAGEFDLVLLDLRMPVLSGIDVLREMRKRGDLTRVILCSAFIPERSLIQALSLGVTIFISKPVTLNTLRDVVDDALRDDWKRDLGPVLDLAERLEFSKAAEIIKDWSPPVNKRAADLWKRIYLGISNNCRLDDLIPDARELARIAILRG